LARGRAELEHQGTGGSPRARERRYLEFLEAVTRASAVAEVHAVAIVREAMAADWRAAAWFLERRYPGRWRRRESHEVEHIGSETAPPVQIRAGVQADPAVAAAAHDFLRAVRDARVPGADV
jgi:hypothetical protein